MKRIPAYLSAEYWAMRAEEQDARDEARILRHQVKDANLQEAKEELQKLADKAYAYYLDLGEATLTSYHHHCDALRRNLPACLQNLWDEEELDNAIALKREHLARWDSTDEETVQRIADRARESFDRVYNRICEKCAVEEYLLGILERRLASIRERRLMEAAA